jgi:hypothetical protein
MERTEPRRRSREDSSTAREPGREGRDHKAKKTEQPRRQNEDFVCISRLKWLRTDDGELPFLCVSILFFFASGLICLVFAPYFCVRFSVS